MRWTRCAASSTWKPDMNDDQLEVALRRYLPRHPDPSLRSRVLSGGQPKRVPLRPVDWTLLAAAAALALATVWPGEAGRTPDVLATAYRARVDDMAQGLGGDALAQQLAVIVVAAAAPAANAEDQQ